MAGEIPLTIVGNLTAHPSCATPRVRGCGRELYRRLHPRTYERTTGTWTDGDALFMRCTAWRAPG